MSSTRVALVVCVVLVCLVKCSISCNGYTVKVNNIKNCGSDNVLKVENFSLTLDQSCDVTTRGCVTVTKPFKTAKVHITLDKPPLLHIDGSVDLCRLLNQSKSVAHSFTHFRLPSKCPVEAQKICIRGPKKHNIGRLRHELAVLAGNTSLKTEIEHDNGTTCIDVSVTLTKS